MGRKLLSWGIAFLSLTCMAWADPATQPAGAPSALNPVLLVLPVAPPATGNEAWIARGIQQDLVADLAQMTQARVIAPPSAPAVSDEQAALDQGRQAGAGFVMYGEAQVSGGQLRVTGQVLDVANARPLAALKATAPVDNLFPLEDSLAVQAAHALPAPIGMTASAAPPASSYASVPSSNANPPAPAPAQDSPYVSASPSTDAPPTAAPVVVAPAGTSPYYSYTEAVPPVYYTYNTYGYPDYAWGYPYYSALPWYGGVGLWYGGGWYGRGYWGGRYYGRPFYGRSFYGGGFRGGAFRGGGGFHGGGRR